MIDIEQLKQQALELKLHGVLAHWGEITDEQYPWLARLYGAVYHRSGDAQRPGRSGWRQCPAASIETLRQARLAGN